MYLLHKAITFAATLFLLLELHELKLTEWLKDVLEVLFVD